MRRFQRITHLVPVLSLTTVVLVAALVATGAGASNSATVGDQLTVSLAAPPSTSLGPGPLGKGKSMVRRARIRLAHLSGSVGRLPARPRGLLAVRGQGEHGLPRSHCAKG